MWSATILCPHVHILYISLTKMLYDAADAYKAIILDCFE